MPHLTRAISTGSAALAVMKRRAVPRSASSRFTMRITAGIPRTSDRNSGSQGSRLPVSRVPESTRRTATASSQAEARADGRADSLKSTGTWHRVRLTAGARMAHAFPGAVLVSVPCLSHFLALRGGQHLSDGNARLQALRGGMGHQPHAAVLKVLQRDHVDGRRGEQLALLFTEGTHLLMHRPGFLPRALQNCVNAHALGVGDTEMLHPDLAPMPWAMSTVRRMTVVARVRHGRRLLRSRGSLSMGRRLHQQGAQRQGRHEASGKGTQIGVHQVSPICKATRIPMARNACCEAGLSASWPCRVQVCFVVTNAEADGMDREGRELDTFACYCSSAMKSKDDHRERRIADLPTSLRRLYKESGRP